MKYFYIVLFCSIFGFCSETKLDPLLEMALQKTEQLKTSSQKAVAYADIAYAYMHQNLRLDSDVIGNLAEKSTKVAIDYKTKADEILKKTAIIIGIESAQAGVALISLLSSIYEKVNALTDIAFFAHKLNRKHDYEQVVSIIEELVGNHGITVKKPEEMDMLYQALAQALVFKDLKKTEEYLEKVVSLEAKAYTYADIAQRISDIDKEESKRYMALSKKLIGNFENDLKKVMFYALIIMKERKVDKEDAKKTIALAKSIANKLPYKERLLAIGSYISYLAHLDIEDAKKEVRKFTWNLKHLEENEAKWKFMQAIARAQALYDVNASLETIKKIKKAAIQDETYMLIGVDLVPYNIETSCRFIKCIKDPTTYITAFTEVVKDKALVDKAWTNK
jgi:hypothetical protein